MSDTDSTSKRPWQFQPGNEAGKGRRPRRLTKDVEDFLVDALNIQGARMLVEAMTKATKLCGKDAVEHPDWAMRIHSFEVIRDTTLGRPAQAITNEDGSPLLSGAFGAELIAALGNLKK